MKQGQTSEEYYRDKLVEWMSNHDIPTGSSAIEFSDLLEVIGTYIDRLKKESEDRRADAV